jgi:inner membrane transporter RhtA
MHTHGFAGSLQRVPATFLVMIAVISVQFGAAMARDLFPVIGPGGTVWLRLGVAILFLTLIFRPTIWRTFRSHPKVMILFGMSIALSTLFFYMAVERIPLGIAISIEFLGPLVVAVANARHWRDRLWILLAAASLATLIPDIGTNIDPWGMLAALVAGVFWGLYIVISPKVGAVANEFDGLVVALIVAWFIMVIPGISQGGTALLQPEILWQSLLMGLAAAVVPFTCEFSALQRIPARVYGVLVCTEPIAGTIIGFFVLNEMLSLQALLAVIGVTIASVGATLSNKETA